MAHISKKTVLEVDHFYLKVIQKVDTTTILIRYFDEEINLKPQTFKDLTTAIQQLRTVKIAFERSEAHADIKEEAITCVDSELMRLLLKYFDYVSTSMTQKRPKTPEK